MTIELNPCPFCGGEGYIDIASESPKNYTIRCNCCRMSTRWFEDGQKAADAWNRRADGWIDVKDKLPEEDGSYLCWFADGFHGIYNWAGGPYSLWDDVTHWMPLPEPPGGAGK